MIDQLAEIAGQVLMLSGWALVLVVLTMVVASVSYRILGRRWILATGLIGVPVHELAHLSVAKLFGMKITRLSLFSPDPESPQLGSVGFSYNPGNPFQSIGLFFVGVAPLLAGAALVDILLNFSGMHTLPAIASSILDGGWPRSFADFGGLASEFFRRNWRLPSGWLPAVAGWAAISVAMHSAPSRADLFIAGRGLVWVAVLLWLFLAPILVVAGWSVWSGDQPPGWLAYGAWALMQACLVSLMVSGVFAGVGILGFAVQRTLGRSGHSGR